MSKHFVYNVLKVYKYTLIMSATYGMVKGSYVGLMRQPNYVTLTDQINSTLAIVKYETTIYGLLYLRSAIFGPFDVLQNIYYYLKYGYIPKQKRLCIHIEEKYPSITLTDGNDKKIKFIIYDDSK
uniref:Uncharacterized protein n=1 Tax=viral metagenome TaxID=1070528 RepID=A0A6C0H637_9ZZZZ